MHSATGCSWPLFFWFTYPLPPPLPICNQKPKWVQPVTWTKVILVVSKQAVVLVFWCSDSRVCLVVVFIYISVLRLEGI